MAGVQGATLAAETTIATQATSTSIANTASSAAINAPKELAKAGLKPLGDGISKLKCNNCGINIDAAKSGITAFDKAVAGGKHSGFLKNYLDRSADEISKSITSMQTGNQGINIHLDKIANPTKYVPNWISLRISHQQSLINGWQNTVTKHTEQIQILQTLLTGK